jgi:hypothetical protein
MSGQFVVSPPVAVPLSLLNSERDWRIGLDGLWRPLYTNCRDEGKDTDEGIFGNETPSLGDDYQEVEPKLNCCTKTPAAAPIKPLTRHIRENGF